MLFNKTANGQKKEQKNKYSVEKPEWHVTLTTRWAMSKYIWYRKNVGPKKYHRNTISLRGTIRNNGVHAPIVPSPLPFDPHSTHIKIMVMMSTYFLENTLLYTQIQVPP